MKEMIKTLRLFSWQTLFFLLTMAIYMIALFWTTIQAFLRLEYSRTDMSKPIVIEIPPSDKS